MTGKSAKYGMEYLELAFKHWLIENAGRVDITDKELVAASAFYAGANAGIELSKIITAHTVQAE